MNRPFRKSWIAVPPWITLGAIIVLVPIFLFWTVQNIRKQKESMTLLLYEKGAALIRSFEAGTRTGMMGMMGGMRGGGFQLQRLLVETAKQPDIVHLLVTDTDGNIIAHSNSQEIGGSYGRDLDLEELAGVEKPRWRRITTDDGTTAFEVFRRFSPTQPPGRGFGRMQRMRPQDSLVSPWDHDQRLVIFVGLEMDTVEQAARSDVRQSIITAVVLLLIGFAGMVLLFLAQAYRTTRTSLTRIRAFSEKVVESMPIGLLTLDHEGIITTMNHAAEAALGTGPEALVGAKARETLPLPLWSLLTKPETEKWAMIGKEIEITGGQGKTVPMDVSVSLLEDEDGAFLGHIILFRDLTEVQSLKREIETSRRLASLGRLAAGIAHEIRNPLSSIKGFATYFRERYSGIPEDKGNAEIMIKEVDRLNRVISQLLEFARPMTVHKRPSSPGKIIRHSLKMIQRQAMEKEIRVSTDLPEWIQETEIDPDRVGQVLLNLYLNSIEAMEKGGELKVHLHPSSGRKGIEIEVSDTGSGIRNEDIAHIFDPYFTTRQSGTGLGLAIVHNIMESHGGEVRVESEPGKGTKVTLYFPEGKA
ncbi:MAG: PAS domain S-box protein [Desulfobacteraceae bacterium]|nr:MAG: PAS domain S-box protein [Desulfobacteraceae bacterium]